jgi:spore germination cell wall hydrolase CwlJ-like protein
MLVFAAELACGVAVELARDGTSPPANVRMPDDGTASAVMYRQELKGPPVYMTQPEESVTDMPVEAGVYFVDLRGTRYEGLYITTDDIRLAADIVAIEARGEPYDGQVAVAEVIFNRCLADNFPDTVREVVFQKSTRLQFTSVVSLGHIYAADKQYRAVMEALRGPGILPVDVVYFSVGGENANVWGKIGRHTFCYQYGWKG